VTLFLPRTWEQPAQPDEQGAAVDAKHHAGTVLLVEDNVEVAEVTKAYLEELGYTVKQALSAQAGLDRIGHDGDIDLVFSDILMPGGMNGLELADAVRRRFPAIGVLLTTGYSSSAQDAVARGFAVLHKPYNLAELDRAVRDARRGGAAQPSRKTQPAVG
jgi:two-component system NtrC family sensor kinase